MRAPISARPARAALLWSTAMCGLWAASSAALNPIDAIDLLDGLSYASMLLFVAAIGLLIARHDPAQPVGWLFSLCAALVTTSIGIGEFAHWAAADAKLPGAVFAFWLALWP